MGDFNHEKKRGSIPFNVESEVASDLSIRIAAKVAFRTHKEEYLDPNVILEELCEEYKDREKERNFVIYVSGRMYEEFHSGGGIVGMLTGTGGAIRHTMAEMNQHKFDTEEELYKHMRAKYDEGRKKHETQKLIDEAMSKNIENMDNQI